MAKTGKCIECGAHRILKGDVCKRCNSNVFIREDNREEAVA